MSRTRLAWVGLLLAAQLTGCSGSGSIKEGLGKAMGKVFEPLVEAMTVGFLAQIHYSLKGRWPQSVEELRNLSQEVPELAQELGDLGLALQQISSSTLLHNK